MSELKITIDQLKNYLGTGLEIRIVRKGSFTTSPDNISFEKFSARDFGIVFKKRYGVKESKPVCYRLSDLDKEIEVNGERFVPAIELAKLITQAGWDYKKIVGISSENDTITVRWPINTMMNWETQNFFEIDTDEDFGFNIFTKTTLGSNIGLNEEGEDQYLTGNVWQMYQKLFEWHFWPFGEDYFEQGLVIDKMKTK